MAKKNNRFVVVYEEGSAMNMDGKKEILCDTVTGVEYLLIYNGYGTSITPLLDGQGKPIVDLTEVKL